MRERVLRTLTAKPWSFAVALTVVLLIANQLAQSSFGTPSSWPTTLADFSPFALAAIATTPAVLSGGGGLDISIGPLLNLVSVVVVGELLVHGTTSIWIDVPVALLIGAFVGAINGFLVGFLRYQAVLATLCALFVLTGLGQALVSSPANATTGWLNDLGGKIGPIPGALVLLIVPFLIWGALGRTAFVRTLYAVGGDEVASYSAGIDTRVVRMAAYMIGGLFAGLAGLSLVAATQTGDPTQSANYILPAIAAVAIGGTSLLGGRGSLIGSLAGAAIIFLIQTLLDGIGVSTNWLQLVYGAVLIGSIVLGSLLNSAAASARIETG
jgi:ribose transport system permease protein